MYECILSYIKYVKSNEVGRYIPNNTTTHSIIFHSDVNKES